MLQMLITDMLIEFLTHLNEKKFAGITTYVFKGIHYYLLIYFKPLEVRALKYIKSPYFLSLPGFAWQACLKMTGVKLELLTDPNMLLIVEKRIRGVISHVLHGYAKVNNKHMKNYDKNKNLHFQSIKT